MASHRAANVHQLDESDDSDVREGWEYVSQVKKNGSRVKGHTKAKELKEVKNKDEIECANALLDLSTEKRSEAECSRALVHISAKKNGECRTSRRLAGLEPELRDDFMFTRALEYVIKDKPHL